MAKSRIQVCIEPETLAGLDALKRDKSRSALIEMICKKYVSDKMALNPSETE